jgi:16S rRNA (guanine966-N2)-methyltransferase
VRIVGGKLAGRDLASPKDTRVRPTAEPVRAALLDFLSPELPDARVLDLFAGSGGLGLEAISRGARSCDFVEFRPSSLHALKANIAKLKLRERTRVFKKDAIVFLLGIDGQPRGSDPRPYDIVFADPPYGSRLLDRTIELWRERRFSRILAVEHEKGHQLPSGAHRKVFAETVIVVYR